MAYIVSILTITMQTIVAVKGVTMILMSEIGKRLRALRESREMSQQAVADYCGVSRVAVTKWENGDTANMKLKNVTQLMRLYNISYDELTTGKKTTQAEKAAMLINSLASEHERDFALHAMRIVAARIKHGTNGETQIPLISIDQEFDKDSQ